LILTVGGFISFFFKLAAVTYYFSCVANQRGSIIPRVRIPDLNQPVTTSADYFLVIEFTTVNSYEKRVKTSQLKP